MVDIYIYYEEECDVNLIPVKVYYNPNGIANILCMAEVADTFYVTII